MVQVPLNPSLEDCTENNHGATSPAPGISFSSFITLLVDILLEFIEFTKLTWMEPSYPKLILLPAASDILDHYIEWVLWKQI